MIVYLARDIPQFVMYCVNGKPRSPLFIESTDSMIYMANVKQIITLVFLHFCMMTVVKIGIVGSVIVFPVEIVILTYHLYCGRHTKEKGMSLQYPCIASFNMGIISHLQLCIL